MGGRGVVVVVGCGKCLVYVLIWVAGGGRKATTAAGAGAGEGSPDLPSSSPPPTMSAGGCLLVLPLPLWAARLVGGVGSRGWPALPGAAGAAGAGAAVPGAPAASLWLLASVLAIIIGRWQWWLLPRAHFFWAAADRKKRVAGEGSSQGSFFWHHPKRPPQRWGGRGRSLGPLDDWQPKFSAGTLRWHHGNTIRFSVALAAEVVEPLPLHQVSSPLSQANLMRCGRGGMPIVAHAQRADRIGSVESTRTADDDDGKSTHTHTPIQSWTRRLLCLVACLLACLQRVLTARARCWAELRAAVLKQHGVAPLVLAPRPEGDHTKY
ncbi:hypothetical protein PCL_06530 [Purpureocillium lilacinum]|uniref:Uncharacterized protein n=1 Tax=Purpureocillium lilacinum TaxID=33203 RepID=A0A2U3EN11_PURLI|nr:hypothetical protein PCL_06530 [Purpureocillium lilacinum]